MHGMLGLGRRWQLAVEAVLDIALHGGGSAVQSKDTAARLALPRRYLEQMMQQLVRAGILKGLRGPRGGYRLARERRRISVADVIAAVHVNRQEGESDESQAASPIVHRVLDPLWTEIESAVLDRLVKVTIEDLCSRVEQTGCAPRSQNADFAI